MSAVPFDTLKLARRLEAAGFPSKQAGDTAEALAEAVGTEIATKADIQAVRADLQAVERKLGADIRALEQKVGADLRDVEQKLRGDFRGLEQKSSTDLRDLEQRLTIKLGTMIFVLGGFLTAIRYWG
jgi:hypothetical protein